MQQTYILTYSMFKKGAYNRCGVWSDLDSHQQGHRRVSGVVGVAAGHLELVFLPNLTEAWLAWKNKGFCLTRLLKAEFNLKGVAFI